MLLDRFGLRVATREPAAIVALDRFADEVLSHGKEANAILAGAEADPDCALAQAYAGALYLFLYTSEGRAKALPYLTRAKASLRRGTERERLVVAAVDAWWRGDVAGALDRHIEVCRQYPRDLLNAKLAQIHQLSLGERGAMRELSQKVLRANRDIGFAWSLSAFALDQCGETARAEEHGRRAVAMNRNDPWAHHAVAHVLANAGRLREGISWMEQWNPYWERCSSFMYTHNWWHTALFHIDLGQPDQALRLFDTRVWGVRKAYVQDQVNAIALLSRLELQGVGGNEIRWQDVAAHVRPRIHDHLNGFLDLHYIYALARAGHAGAVSEMLASLHEHAASIGGPTGTVWSEIAAPAARGLAAHAEGRPSVAAALLGPVRHRLGKLGGSTIQQDWFEWIFFDSLIRAEVGAEARPLRGPRARCRSAAQPPRRQTIELTSRILDGANVATAVAVPGPGFARAMTPAVESAQ